MRMIDLTHAISEDMPVYPGTEPPVLAPANGYSDSGFKETRIHLHSHTGTHMDPPAHIFPGRTTLDAFPVGQFAGKALVVDCRALKEGEAITMACLAPWGELAARAEYLLFNLGWDAKWGTPEYFGDYPVIDDHVLDFILATGKKGIGFDVIGVDPIADVNLTRHKKLFLDHEIVNIENLTNLDKCGSELFWFFALPMKVLDSDGAPVRAVAFWPQG